MSDNSGDESYIQTSKKRPLDDSSNGYDDNKRTNFGIGKPTLKFLIPNFIAGKLIGKGGSNIGELQAKYNATIQISRNQERYPGTTDRVVAMSADTDRLVEFNDYLISELEEEEKSEMSNPSLKFDVKLVITNIAAGLVIGKGGASIRAIEADNSGAKIRISKKEESIDGERVLVVSGDAHQRAKACKQIIEIMSAVPDRMSNNNVNYDNFNSARQMPQNNHPDTYSSRQMPQNNLPDTFNSSRLMPQNSVTAHNQNLNDTNVINNVLQALGNLGNNSNSNYQQKSAVKATFNAELEVPDIMVSVIIGKQGQTIGELSRKSSARLKFSDKDEFAPGTTNRILTITGGMYQVQNAYILVDEMLTQMERELAGGGYGRQ